VDSHSQGGGPSVATGGTVATRGTTGDFGAACGAVGVGVAVPGATGDDWAT
jgi:hypothetical protein